jgi:NAD(P)-dependent dehydrogenase (short-subunit alcohol dehydrogenase family)
MSSRRFESRSVLVTGGTSGLGREVALAFAREGARVTITGRRRPAGEETVNALRAAGGEAQFVQADVADEGDAAAMVRACVQAYGGLDFACNNAGVDGAGMIPTAEYEAGVGPGHHFCQPTGVFLSMKYELPAMLVVAVV